MPLLDKLQKDMVAAMKAKEELKLGAIRMMKTALMQGESRQAMPLDEAAEMRILNMLLKQRRESVEMFRKGGREDRRRRKRLKSRSSKLHARPRHREEIEAAIEAAS
jgi:uncharacterized protein